MTSLREIDEAEVARHSTRGDAWVVVDGLVYDVSKFARMHPGGERILLKYAGKDASAEFWSLHRGDVLEKYKKLVLGRTKAYKGDEATAAARPLFSQVPYAEILAVQKGFVSPYFNESHVTLKTRLREMYRKDFAKECAQLDVAGTYPPIELYKRLAQAGGVLPACLGPGPWLKGRTLLGVKGEDFDAFHEMVFHQEFARLGSQGFTDGLGGGLGIGLPAVAYFAQPKLKERIMAETLGGDKRLCLAISEPYVGSDVAQLQCEARKSADGTHFVVNGEKKWITGGVFADYFATAVRTGGKGIDGISMLLIPRGAGVETKQIPTTYSRSAGTAYVTFVDVKVPVENLIGKENKGFMCVMANFNHERWGMVVAVAERCRVVVEECFKWAKQRMLFGKPLLAMAVVRQKLAEMAAATESLQHWLDSVTCQMNNMTVMQQAKRLAGQISLLKYHSTRVSHKVADNAAQIFGGRAITKTGMGYKVEQFITNVKFSAILGGSEEVLADFAVRHAAKSVPESARL